MMLRKAFAKLPPRCSRLQHDAGPMVFQVSIGLGALKQQLLIAIKAMHFLVQEWHERQPCLLAAAQMPLGVLGLARITEHKSALGQLQCLRTAVSEPMEPAVRAGELIHVSSSALKTQDLISVTALDHVFHVVSAPQDVQPGSDPSRQHGGG